MVKNLKQGLRSGQISAEEVISDFHSGGKLTTQQKGTYTTDGADTFTAFTDTFTGTPLVMISPTQAHGIEGPIVATRDGSGFDVSGAIAHTGIYVAFEA
ncbi:MAG TPA: hypothetical protein ENH95_06815 [Nitrosopumilus sp.]|nr:hypothetical protein [Nitrosopumilus sp.]